MLEAELILVAVVLVHFAPIASDVSDEVGKRVVPDALNASRAPGVARTEPGENLIPLTWPS